MIAIIDYDMGNLGSIKNMIKKIGGQSIISNNKSDLMKAEGIILPGVGSFDTGVRNLKKYDLYNYIQDLAKDKQIPILGICLGMQMMTRGSEEGTQEGLGWVAADTVKFSPANNLKT